MEEGLNQNKPKISTSDREMGHFLVPYDTYSWTQDVRAEGFFNPQHRLFDTSHPAFSSAFVILCDQIWYYSVLSFAETVFVLPHQLKLGRQLFSSILPGFARLQEVVINLVGFISILAIACREHRYIDYFDVTNAIRINPSFRTSVIFFFVSLSYGLGLWLQIRYAQRFDQWLRWLDILDQHDPSGLQLTTSLILIGSWAIYPRIELLEYKAIIYFARIGLRIPYSLLVYCRGNIDHLRSCRNSSLTRQFLNAGMHSCSAYKYQPLCDKARKFRLLRIHSGLFSAHCKLITCAGNDGNIPAYDAISWRWDGLEKLHAVVVDGQSLAITKRVSDIIHKLTPSIGVRYLWVDSLCINQENDLEKASQIQLMSQLYCRATRVIAYLGDAEDSSLVSDFIGRLDVVACQRLDKKLVRVTDPPSSFPFGDEARNWKALQDLFRHPLWSRTWIVQEITLAEKVTILYGDHFLDWTTLARVAQCLEHGNSLYGGAVLSMSEYFGRDKESCLQGRANITFLANARELYSNSKRVSLSRILLEAQGVEATDDRDRVYGLQALDPSLRTPELRPNYSISVERLYTTLARHWLEAGSSSLLAFAGITHRRSLAIPSWVPDLTMIPEVVPLQGVSCKYCVSGATSIVIDSNTSQRSSNAIRIKGVLLDRICRISTNGFMLRTRAQFGDDMRKHTGFELRILDYLNDVLGMAAEHINMTDPGQCKTNEPFMEAVLRTLIGDEDDTHFPASKELMGPFVHSAACALFLPEAETMGTPYDMRSRGTENRIRVDNLVHFLRRKAAGRHFAITSSGYLCLVPEATELGDRICVFLGSKVPYVIRKPKAKRNSWQLVGESYVQGIMDGKRVSHLLKIRDAARWIELH